MLSRIDDIIYPNRCEVIEFTDPQRFVYPIFKNGSSSLTEYARQQGYKTLLNEQIKKIKIIDVILRNPQDRFISGLNTFLWMTKRDHPDLDTKTILHFAENYLFLNRHYAPQLSWLINLNKYISADAQLRLHDMSLLSEFTTKQMAPIEDKLLSEEQITRLRENIHNELYIRLDSLLLQLIGKEMPFREILTYLSEQDPIAYLKLKCTALD
jgi:hypothetical protein